MHARSLTQKAVALLLSASTTMGVVAPGVGHAANNSLSNVSRLPTSDGSVLEVLDLTLNTDWDFDANVEQLGVFPAGTRARILDRNYVEALVRQTARTLFVMTNGKHRIGKVYIFKSARFGNEVDIRLLREAGRANAAVSGWKTFGGFTTSNYITNKTESGALEPETPEETGEVVAHELGHYVYGLLDEYAEAGRACNPVPSKQAGTPCKDDITKPTAMHDQALSYRLSVPSDYPSSQSGSNAQSRVYGRADGSGKSAWETLASDPANDTDAAKLEAGGRRVRFDAFKNLPVPALADLKQFSVSAEDKSGRFATQLTAGRLNPVFAGYDSNLQLIFDGTGQVPTQPRNVVLIDRTAPEATFQQFVAAAQGFVDRAPANARLALVTNPASGSPQFLEMDANGRSAIKRTLEQLTRTDGTFDLNGAYEAGKALVTAARAGAGAENAANTDAFTLYAMNTTAVPEGLGVQARNDKIAINVTSLRAPAERSMPASANSLASLARDSGGINTTAKSASEATKESSKAFKEAVGDTESLIASDLTDEVLAPGSTHEVRFKVGPVALDGTVVVSWYFEKADQGRLRFSCVSAVNGQSIPAVIQSTEGSDEGEATCTIGAGRATGEWIARVSVVSGAGAASSVETEVVATPAGGVPVELDANVDGGILAEGRRPLLTVKLAGNFPIIGAKARVDILTATDGKLVKQLTLTAAHDAGTGGDARADDGIYTVDLSGMLPAGTYVALIDASTDANSQFNPVQRFATGTALQATAVGGEIERQAEVEFTLEAGAPGVGIGGTDGTGGAGAAAPAGSTPAATENRHSGGCTVGGGSDAGLLLLLGAAGAMMALRRIQRRRERRDAAHG